MANILINIVAWAFCALICMGVLGLIVIMVQMVCYFFRRKTANGALTSMPWWVWWSAHNNR